MAWVQARALRWRRTVVQTAYRLLYGRMASWYDLAAVIASGGQWWDWQRAVLPWVQGPRVLDLACGTGHVLADLRRAGFPAYGLDPSTPMLGRARGYLAQERIPASLILADARHLPVRAGTLNTITMTFSGLSLDPQVLAEVRRALAPGGRLIILDQVHLTAPTLRTRWSRLALGLTNVAPEYPIVERLWDAGFVAGVHNVMVKGNTAVVVVASPASPRSGA